MDSRNSFDPQHTREDYGSVIAQLWKLPDDMYDAGRVRLVVVVESYGWFCL